MHYEFDKIIEDISRDNFKIYDIPEFNNNKKTKMYVLSEMPDYELYLNNKKKLQERNYNNETEFFQYNTEEPLLTKEQEVHLFRKMHYFKYCCKKLLLKYSNKDTRITRKKIIENYCNFQNLRHLIHKANLKLVSQSLKKRRNFYGLNNMDDLFSDAFMNILKAVDNFDYRRGIKFSTFACWCLLNNSLRDHQQNKKFETYNSSNRESDVFEKPNNEESFYEFENKESGLSDWVKIKDYFLKSNKIREITIVEKVFGLGGIEKKTIAEIAVELNLTKERIRQLREKTLDEIKSYIKIGRIKVDGI